MHTPKTITGGSAFQMKIQRRPAETIISIGAKVFSTKIQNIYKINWKSLDSTR